ncbi:hypothetical protein [Aeromicrobium sp. UC242_57]|uniref:hypothetical protein n=1 Tax=Aeromicrobium sp. UC242_57 TaxID=3374624 RepID=UPI0037BDCA20
MSRSTSRDSRNAWAARCITTAVLTRSSIRPGATMRPQGEPRRPTGQVSQSSGRTYPARRGWGRGATVPPRAQEPPDA